MNKFGGCPIVVNANTLEKKWMMRIVWELHGGPKRFNELKRSMDGITQAVLSSRLKELEKSSLVLKQTNNGAMEYALNCGKTDDLFSCWKVK